MARRSTSKSETTLLERARMRAHRLRTFRRDERGVTAIEFALLAFPFLVLLFMILELAIVFYISSALDHATSQATRLVRTGQAQMASNEPTDQLKDYTDSICKSLAAFADCESKIRVDLVRASDNRFKPDMLPASPAPAAGGTAGVPIVVGGATSTPASRFQATCPGDVVMVRTEFYHQLIIPGKVTFLSNTTANRRVLRSVTAFRNEPYPAQPGASCGAST